MSQLIIKNPAPCQIQFEGTVRFRFTQLAAGSGLVIRTGPQQWLANGQESRTAHRMPEGGNSIVNRIGLAVFGAVASSRTETDLAQERQIRRQPTGAQAFPNSLRHARPCSVARRAQSLSRCRQPRQVRSQGMWATCILAFRFAAGSKQTAQPVSRVERQQAAGSNFQDVAARANGMFGFHRAFPLCANPHPITRQAFQSEPHVGSHRTAKIV